MLGLTAIFLLMTGCVNTPSDSAICDGTVAERKALAQASLADGGPLSKEAAADLLDKLAVCEGM